jgi:hypothetical protein
VAAYREAAGASRTLGATGAVRAGVALLRFGIDVALEVRTGLDVVDGLEGVETGDNASGRGVQRVRQRQDGVIHLAQLGTQAGNLVIHLRTRVRFADGDDLTGAGEFDLRRYAVRREFDSGGRGVGHGKDGGGGKHVGTTHRVSDG